MASPAPPDDRTPPYPQAWSVLRCPLTGQLLTAMDGSSLETMLAGVPLLSGRNGKLRSVDAPEVLLVTADLTIGYLVSDGIPILLAPERLHLNGPPPEVDLTDPDMLKLTERWATTSGWPASLRSNSKEAPMLLGES